MLTGSGYVLPAADGVVVTGSTYDRGNDDPELQAQGHEANLRRLALLLPDARIAADAARVDGAVGFRCVAPDRMPLVGAMPDVVSAFAGPHRPSRRRPRCPARSWPICRDAPGFTAPLDTRRAGWYGHRWPARCWLA